MQTLLAPNYAQMHGRVRAKKMILEHANSKSLKCLQKMFDDERFAEAGSRCWVNSVDTAAKAVCLHPDHPRDHPRLINAEHQIQFINSFDYVRPIKRRLWIIRQSFDDRTPLTYPPVCRVPHEQFAKSLANFLGNRKVYLVV